MHYNTTLSLRFALHSMESIIFFSILNNSGSNTSSTSRSCAASVFILVFHSINWIYAICYASQFYFGFEWRQCYHNKRYEMARMLNMWWNRIKLTSPIVNKYMAKRQCKKKKTVDERDTLECTHTYIQRDAKNEKKKAFVHRVLWCGVKWLAKIIGCARGKCKKHRVAKHIYSWIWIKCLRSTSTQNATDGTSFDRWL